LDRVTHIDSCILRAMIDMDDDAENRRTIRHLLNARIGGSFRVSICSIGEVMGKMAEASKVATCAESGAELRRLFLKNRMELFGLGQGREVVDIAESIVDQDSRLTPADVMIFSSAVADPQCGIFLTLDHQLMESGVLNRIATKRGLKIIMPDPGQKRSHGSCSMSCRSKEVTEWDAGVLRERHGDNTPQSIRCPPHPLSSSQ